MATSFARVPDVAVFSGGPWLRRLRLATGCILFTYVFLHLLDHASGNISLAAMERVLLVQKFIWQSEPGTVLLYVSLITHGLLGVWSLYARRYVGWSATEIVQLGLGLCIPPLLANHLAVTRGALDLYGIDKAYAQELATLWVVLPVLGVVQVSVLVVAWSHACIGLRTAIRLKRWYHRVQPALLVAAVLVPSLALLGFVHAAREVARLMADPAWASAYLAASQTGTPAQIGRLFALRDAFITWDAVLISAVLLARAARAWHETRQRGVAVRFPDGSVAHIPRGLSVLDASRLCRLPHASICGGRGRCSTCRVHVLGGSAEPPPSAAERAVLERVGADPAEIRLACQFRPIRDIVVRPLVPPALAGQFIVGRAGQHVGEERFIVAMFVDLRGSTALIEGRLPFDAVFLLRRFVETASEAVVAAGGEPNQFTGDGILALFGLDTDPATACRQSLNALDLLALGMARLAAQTIGELATPLRYSAGLMCGSAVVGQVGYRGHSTLTALGEVVHVAARLEALTRAFACDAVVADDVLRGAGHAGIQDRVASGWAAEFRPAVAVRGRAAPLAVHLLRGR